MSTTKRKGATGHAPAKKTSRKHKQKVSVGARNRKSRSGAEKQTRNDTSGEPAKPVTATAAPTAASKVTAEERGAATFILPDLPTPPRDVRAWAMDVTAAGPLRPPRQLFCTGDEGDHEASDEDDVDDVPQDDSDEYEDDDQDSHDDVQDSDAGEDDILYEEVMAAYLIAYMMTTSCSAVAVFVALMQMRRNQRNRHYLYQSAF